MASATIRLVTFNILHDGVRQSIGPWSSRRTLVLDLLRSARADILCLQEVSPRQQADLAAGLEEFECHPGDLSGPTRLPPFVRILAPYFRSGLGEFFDFGELCPIFFRRSAMRCVGRGCFWAQPHGQEGPESYGTPHIVNWVELETTANGPRLAVYNTHLGLPGKGSEATARNLSHRLAADHRTGVQVLCGDLNSAPAGTATRALLSGADDRPMFDAWPIAARRVGAEGTFRAGRGLPALRIDFVLLRPKIQVLEVETIVGETDGRLPSDHCAVRADLALEG